MKKVWSLALAFVVLFGLAVMPALAHAVLVRSIPEANAALGRAPAQVELFFSEAVDPTFSTIKVLDANGQAVDNGDAQVDPIDAAHLTVSLRSLPDSVYTVSWKALSATDGHCVYYSHLIPDPNGGRKYTNFKYALERVAYSGGQPQKLIGSAFWPRLSPDGSKMAYVSFVPSTNSNDLYLANADGSQAKLVMSAGAFSAVDAPLFAPDGKTIVFSAVGEPQLPNLSWLDQLMGVQIAEAHNVPSDWWRVSIDGGKPERLTQVNGTDMYADFAPDGRHIAFASISGLFVMQPDGSNLIQLSNEGLNGSVSWTP